MKRFWVNGEVCCPKLFHTRAFEIIFCTCITLQSDDHILHLTHTSVWWSVFAKGPVTTSHQYWMNFAPVSKQHYSRWHLRNSAWNPQDTWDIFLFFGWRASFWGNSSLWWGNNERFPSFLYDICDYMLVASGVDFPSSFVLKLRSSVASESSTQRMPAKIEMRWLWKPT